MWSRSADRASWWHQGKMQWPSRRMTSSRIHAGGSWPSTESVRPRSRTGWMVTWEWPTHCLIRSRVAAPSFSTVTRGDGFRRAGAAVGGEVGQVEVEVEPGLGLPRGGGGLGAVAVPGPNECGEVELGLLGGDDAQGLGLADLQLVGVAEGLELGGVVADEVVEGGEVEGVAGDVEPG